MTTEERLKTIYNRGYENGFEGMYENNHESPFREAYDRGWDDGNTAYADTEWDKHWVAQCTP